MTEEELTKELLGIVAVLADEIYFQKCMYFNVPELPKPDEEACIDEAFKALPTFLEAYKMYGDALAAFIETDAEIFCKLGERKEEDA